MQHWNSLCSTVLPNTQLHFGILKQASSIFHLSLSIYLLVIFLINQFIFVIFTSHMFCFVQPKSIFQICSFYYQNRQRKQSSHQSVTFCHFSWKKKIINWLSELFLISCLFMTNSLQFAVFHCLLRVQGDQHRINCKSNSKICVILNRYMEENPWERAIICF